MRRLTSLLATAALSLAAAFAAPASRRVPAQAGAAAEPVDSVAEAVATVFGTHVRQSLLNLNMLGVDVDHKAFMAAMDRVLRGEPTAFDFDGANAFLTRNIDSRRPRTAVVDTLSVESQRAFVDSVAALPGAITTPSGLVFIEESAGSGEHPKDTDEVEVIYSGRFYDGVQFDLTDRPIAFIVNNLTPGFAEGLKLMRPGGRYRLVMPASLGYGAEGIPGAIPGNAALDFTVELISIK